ncbi:f-box cyclin [Fusarium longipes]|uniref:F-box cyclin n=1 Tax=Fusarium longipes TaxID=694270 RepID=A0A395SCJ1_9HYPO|nr:f-box cyclin [Fusarium longipes]
MNQLQQAPVESQLLPSSPLRKQQSSECFLLDLPNEILQQIDEYLPFNSRVCIRLTCTVAHDCLRAFPRCPSQEEWLVFLAQFYKNRPDYVLVVERPWVLAIRDDELPMPPNVPPVLHWPSWSKKQMDRFERGALMVDHEHVQLAIKYNQLEHKKRWQKRFLKIVLRPHKTRFEPRFYGHPDNEKVEEICYFEGYTKVISGRYITFSQRRFTNKDPLDPMRISKLGSFGSCTHQHTSPVRYGHFLRRKGLLSVRGSSRHHIGGPTSVWRHQRPLEPECSDLFFSSIYRASCEHGTWFDGACPWCLTEFSICFKEGDLVLKTWRDLGGADSPLNDVWLKHTGEYQGEEMAEIRCPTEIRSRYEDSVSFVKRVCSHFGHCAPSRETRFHCLQTFRNAAVSETYADPTGRSPGEEPQESQELAGQSLRDERD